MQCPLGTRRDEALGVRDPGRVPPSATVPHGHAAAVSFTARRARRLRARLSEGRGTAGAHAPALIDRSACLQWSRSAPTAPPFPLRMPGSLPQGFSRALARAEKSLENAVKSCVNPPETRVSTHAAGIKAAAAYLVQRYEGGKRQPMPRTAPWYGRLASEGQRPAGDDHRMLRQPPINLNAIFGADLGEAFHSLATLANLVPAL